MYCVGSYISVNYPQKIQIKRNRENELGEMNITSEKHTIMNLQTAGKPSDINCLRINCVYGTQ